MKGLLRWGGIFLALIFLGVFTGCEKEIKEQKRGKTLNDGAIISEGNGKIKNLNLVENNYAEEEGEIITNYSNKDAYIFLEDGKHKIFYKGETFDIKDENYVDLKLSKDGEYLSYMTYNEGYSLKTIRLKDREEIKIEEKTRISGTFFDFVDREKIVYYGVSQEKKGGIYIFDLKEMVEKPLYILEKGYVEFLKGYGDEVLILENFNGEKRLKAIKIDSSKAEILSKEVELIEDIVKKEDEYFFLGRSVRDGDSLYKIKEGDIERLVYDFPKKVYLKGGLGISGDNVVFIGFDNTLEERNIYFYNRDGVAIKSREANEYVLVKR